MEPPRGASQERRFQRSLRAEVRDPLWFLTQAMAVRRIRGRGCRSPIDARIACDAAVLDAFEIDRPDSCAVRSRDAPRGTCRTRTGAVRPDAAHAAGARVRAAVGDRGAPRASRRLRRNLIRSITTRRRGVPTQTRPEACSRWRGRSCSTRRAAGGGPRRLARRRPSRVSWPDAPRRNDLLTQAGAAGRVVRQRRTCSQPDAEQPAWQRIGSNTASRAGDAAETSGSRRTATPAAISIGNPEHLRASSDGYSGLGSGSSRYASPSAPSRNPPE